MTSGFSFQANNNLSAIDKTSGQSNTNTGITVLLKRPKSLIVAGRTKSSVGTFTYNPFLVKFTEAIKQLDPAICTDQPTQILLDSNGNIFNKLSIMSFASRHNFPSYCHYVSQLLHTQHHIIIHQKTNVYFE